MHQSSPVRGQAPQAKAGVELTTTVVRRLSVLSVILGSDEASQLAPAFNALGEPVLVRLVSMLANAPDGEPCVCDLVERLGKSQGTVSHHLRVLCEAGLAHGDRRRKWVWYPLDREWLDTLKEALDS
jgi:ArsR family transcriptional regulator, arsenate/arsenite/antimonite-responsive transcriptional repressor